jgi:type II secretory pathway pseudopilin PulG
MRSGRRHRTAWVPRPAAAGAAGAGFTTVEVLVAIAVIGIISTALMTFFVTTVSATSRQSHQQVAVQLATDGAERVRAIKNSAIVKGRDRISSDSQWPSRPTGFDPYMAETYDGTAAYPAGASAPLPTTALAVTINNVAYQQNFFLGTCWQPLVGGDCVAGTAPGSIWFYRVVLAVTWVDPRCGAAGCSFVISTLINHVAEDPIFNPSLTAHPPTVDNPGSQVGEVSAAASLQLTASGGAPPLIWSAISLPPGLSISSAGLISGTPTTAGSYSASVSVTDGYNLVGTAVFGWTINPVLTLTSPGNQTSNASAAITALQLATRAAGGIAPLTWSVSAGLWGLTGLPPGLAINATTGAITGTPILAGLAQPLTVTVTDSVGKTASVTFSWTITALPLTATAVAAQSAVDGTAIAALQLAATGGILPYTWAATNLPPGLTVTAAGLVSGAPTDGTRYLAAATVTDSVGATAVVTIVWAVSTNNVRVTAPTANRASGRISQTVVLDAAGPGSSGGSYTWTATGLPPGITLTSTGTGTLTGTPTTAGVYTVKLTATKTGKNAVFMFTWTVT